MMLIHKRVSAKDALLVLRKPPEGFHLNDQLIDFSEYVSFCHKTLVSGNGVAMKCHVRGSFHSDA